MSFDLPLTALFRSNFFPPSTLYSNFARQLYIDVKILEKPFFLLFSIHLYRIENSRISFNVLKKNIISLHSLRRSPANPLKSQNQSHGNVKIESDPFTSFNIYISPEYIPYIPAHAQRQRIQKNFHRSSLNAFRMHVECAYIYTHRIKAELTTVGVGLWTVSILKTARPRSLVPRRGRGRLPDTVSTLESLRPLAPVYPPATGLHAQSVPLPILPLAFVNRSAEIRYRLTGFEHSKRKTTRYAPRTLINKGFSLGYLLLSSEIFPFDSCVFRLPWLGFRY